MADKRTVVIVVGKLSIRYKNTDGRTLPAGSVRPPRCQLSYCEAAMCFDFKGIETRYIPTWQNET